MNAWLLLAAAILSEVAATTCLAASDGLTRPGPAVAALSGYAVAFYCLSLAIRVIPVGVAYAVWCGAGMVLIAGLAWALQGQALDGPAIAGLLLIGAGVAVINLFSATTAR